MEIPFVSFYDKNNISPVRQNIDDLESHYCRRESLYLSLGILPAFVKDRKVIEFGPGSGHNAVYTAHLQPAHYTLVDGSKVGYNSTKETFAKLGFVHVVHSLFQDFNSEEKYDLVIAEGCLPHQKAPIPLLKHISKSVDSNGVLIITTANGISYLSETLRRLIRDRIMSPDEDTQKQLLALTPVFQPHLATLANMTRPVEDWILDNIVQPLYNVRLLSIPEVVSALESDFEILGSSPKFIEDWRWYKDINKRIKGYNAIALDSYFRKNLNFLDYRYTRHEHTKEFGQKLEVLCEETWILMCTNEKAVTPDWNKLFANLNEIHALISSQAPETAEALSEVTDWLVKADITRPLPYFSSWWGRGQQYLSFRKIN